MNKKIIDIGIIVILSLAIGVGIGIVLSLGSDNNRSISQSDSVKILQLQKQIIELQQSVSDKEDEYDRIKGELEELKESDISSMVSELENILAEYKVGAGLVDVKGQGLVITLEVPETVEYSRVQNLLLLLINELRASDAQAIAINGQRLIAMSEVRVVNNQYTMVNGEKITAPYVIEVIGNPVSLQSGILMGGNGIIYTILGYGLNADWQKEDEIVIKAVSEDLIKTDKMEEITLE